MNDLRLAARHLFKSPGFTVVAVVTLAVGVAATASLFSVIKSLVLDPLPYPDSQRVGQIWAKNAGAILDFMPLSTPDFLDLQEQLTSFEAIGAFSPRRFNLGGDKPESVEGALCTPGVFPAFGVAPLLGRWFTAEDVASRDGASVVIISHALWRQRFAANPGCLGRSLRLDGRDYIVVGVMPEQFELLSMWTRDRTLSLWLPLALSRADRNRGNLWMSSVARLKPDASPDRARAELEAAGGRLATLAPDTNARRTFWFMPLQQGLGGLPALRISVLLGAGWTLLVLAGQNVAAMMLARGISRQSEIAVRIALGASRLRIVRLVLAESLLLAALAGGLGFLLTVWAMDALEAILPAAVMPRSGLIIDGWLLGCIAFLAVLIVQMAGLAPALLASKTNVVSGLKEAGVGHSSARKTQGRLRRLVIAQIAIALLLVSIATQLSGTYRQMVASSRSLVSDQIVTAAVAVKGAKYDHRARVAFWDRFVAITAALPGVTEAGLTTKLPFDGGVSMQMLTDEQVFDPMKPVPYVEVSYVSPRFFSALSVIPLQGRPLAADDFRASRRSVVINRAMARHYWPNQNPIGRRLRPAQAGTTWAAEVVGVIDDVRQVAERPAKPEMYFPYTDEPREEAFLVVRIAPGLPVPLAAIREELRRIDPDLALAGVQSMQALFDKSGRVISVVTTVVDGLTVAILGLAALGLYGTLSFTFARRRRDIGVRLALGAAPGDIVRLIVRQALVWVAIGAAIGTTGSWLLGRATRAMLADATPVDLPQLGTSIAIVLAAAAVASFLPARRATRVNPVEALRAE